MAAGLTPVLLALLFWPRARKASRSVFLAMFVATILTVFGQFFGASYEAGTALIWRLDPILYGFPVATATLIIGTLVETSNKAQNVVEAK